MSNFGKNLRAQREALGLSQEEAATKCGWPGSRGQARWSSYESGRRSPSICQVEKIIKFLGLDPESLFAKPTTNDTESNNGKGKS